jgi:hypothetical protein
LVVGWFGVNKKHVKYFSFKALMQSWAVSTNVILKVSLFLTARASKFFLRLSAISGLTAVLLSAYGSHGITFLIEFF